MPWAGAGSNHQLLATVEVEMERLSASCGTRWKVGNPDLDHVGKAVGLDYLASYRPVSEIMSVEFDQAWQVHCRTLENLRRKESVEVCGLDDIPE